jgi:type VI protein secretion system component VasF
MAGFLDQFGQNINNILEGVSGKNEYELQSMQQEQQSKYLDFLIADAERQNQSLPVWAIGLIAVIVLVVIFLLLKINKVI